MSRRGKEREQQCGCLTKKTAECVCVIQRNTKMQTLLFVRDQKFVADVHERYRTF